MPVSTSITGQLGSWIVTPEGMDVFLSATQHCMQQHPQLCSNACTRRLSPEECSFSHTPPFTLWPIFERGIGTASSNLTPLLSTAAVRGTSAALRSFQHKPSPSSMPNHGLQNGDTSSNSTCVCQLVTTCCSFKQPSACCTHPHTLSITHNPH